MYKKACAQFPVLLRVHIPLLPLRPDAPRELQVIIPSFNLSQPLDQTGYTSLSSTVTFSRSMFITFSSPEWATTLDLRSSIFNSLSFSMHHT